MNVNITTINSITISQAIFSYLNNIMMARSENTTRTYNNALNSFSRVCSQHKLPVEETSITDLPEDAIAWFATALKSYSPSTERLYLSAVAGFYDYLAAEKIASPNLPRVRLLIHQRARQSSQRIPQFPRNTIEIVLLYADNLQSLPSKGKTEKLRNMRDRAFLMTLADTGLRVHEACALRRGDLDWNENKAVIIGKGNRQAVVRFSKRAIRALREYLAARSELDGAMGKPLTTLPIFARHDRGAGKKIKAITTATGRNIVSQRVTEALGQQAIGTVTPHSFRHYFVTTVLRASGNLKLAQELARHKNITVTQRYAHLSDDELDRGYWEVFEN